MIAYPDNVRVGDAVHDDMTGAPYDVEVIRYREGYGWECYTRDPEGYSGPTFYPHPDRMPSADLLSVYDLLLAP